jgi:hypothetical protein
MSIQIETKDCTALGDAELAEMADLCADSPIPHEIGTLSKQAEAWVLVTQARDNDRLKGFSFCTLERIGGTPAVLIGLASIKRTSKRDTVLRGIMTDQLRRAVLAFPDEDVLIGARFCTPAGFEAFKALDRDRAPARAPGLGRGAGVGTAPGQALRHRGLGLRRPGLPGHRRRLAARRARPREPQARGTLPADVAALFDGVDQAKGHSLIAFGWAMAEDLAKLLP